MQFHYQEISTLPPLAWCARIDRRSEVVSLFHGNWVETRPDGFIEGAWDDAFAAFNFIAATIVAGTGGLAEPARVRFSSSTDHLGPLFSIVKRGSVFVSNSAAFVLTQAGEDPDDIYPFYAHDFLRIYRQGLYCPNGRIRLRSARTMGVHFSTIISVDPRCRMRFGSHPQGEAPADYTSYKRVLIDGTRRVFENGADPARKRRYIPLATLSTGYDSTAATVIAKAAGCTEAFTYIDPRRNNPKYDSGAPNARFFLKMDCKAISRWQYLTLARSVEAEFCCGAANTMVPLAGAEELLAGRILVVGESGDTVWYPVAARVADNLAKPWARFAMGLTTVEFRLRVGYFAVAPPFVASRHNRAIHAIATSEEMRPWSLGGDYDRPLPRRIGEEAGLPRDRFGVNKAALAHSLLNEPSRFSPSALRDYRQFVGERHAKVPKWTTRYWQARVRWRHYLWGRKESNEQRYVRPTWLQRHFPFVFNARPVRVSWDYLFAFQWSMASMRSRYLIPAQGERESASARDRTGAVS